MRRSTRRRTRTRRAAAAVNNGFEEAFEAITIGAAAAAADEQPPPSANKSDESESDESESDDDDDDKDPPQPPPLSAATATQPRRAPLQKKSIHDQYYPDFHKFMCWRDGHHYPQGTVFTNIMLQGITAMEFYRYCKFRVYNDPDADETITQPVNLRHNTTLGIKKHCSHFMLNQNMEWNEVAQCGNPTRSGLMKKLIKNIKRMQTQKRGKPSQARRAATNKEYEGLVEQYWSFENKEKGLAAAAVTCCQMALIGRNDDVCKMTKSELKPYDQFPHYAITCKLRWSKNVTKERDCPTQILIGAMDTRYCALCNLGLWLEYNYEMNPAPNDFVFGIEGLEDPERIKKKFGSLFTTTIRRVPKCKPGLTGTHSLRKLASTFARSNGCGKVS
jgi:hypothetical protein